MSRTSRWARRRPRLLRATSLSITRIGLIALVAGLAVMVLARAVAPFSLPARPLLLPLADTNKVAATALKTGNTAVAEQILAWRLSRSPLDAEALLLWSVARARQGDAARAREGVRVAATLGWRSPALQAALYAAAMDRGDAAEAMRRADALARLRPGDRSLLTLLHSTLRLPNGPGLLANALAANPPWRPFFFSFSDLFAADPPAAVGALFERMEGTLRPATSAERQAYVDVLAGRGDYAAARRLGLAGAGDPARIVQDPHLLVIRPAVGIIFGWRTMAPQISARSFGGDNIIPFSFRLDDATAGALVGQVITLPSRPTSLTFTLRAENPGLARRVRWMTRCHKSAATTIHTPILRALAEGDGAYMGEVALPAPAADCPAQDLVLYIDPTAGGMAGEVTLDNVAIGPALA